jgi:hypothetical protein
MNRFWTRDARLGRRLRSERPEPSHDFVGSLLERLDAAAPAKRARRSPALRVGLASAVSLAFLVSLSAFGGLGYAANSLANVGRTASHVVIPQQHRAQPAPIAADASVAATSRGNSSSTQSSSSSPTSASTSATDSSQSRSSSGDSSSNANLGTGVLGGGTSAADDQYNFEIVCLLIFPGTKYEHIVKLPRFLVPFYQSFNPSAVIVTCPVRRGRG